MVSNKIPKSLQSVLWSVNINNLDITKDKEYIIHQVLMCGDLKDYKWLRFIYGKETIKKVFLYKPAKIYPKKTYYFVKNFLLGIKNKQVDDQNYITSIFGPIRQRTAKSISTA